MDELVKTTAREAVALLAKREVSPLELIDAAEARIAEVDGAVNALPTLCFDRARQRARRLMEGPPGDPPPGYLHGLPVAIKDLVDVAGVRTTQGSPIFADRIPERSDISVETLERNGGLVIAKSNTPEFGAGANTFNEVFGATRNPWDTRLTCGGSSGGAAVALATGQVWLADGSDLAGSLRTPASFCSVVGLRPSPGRVAGGPRELPYANLGVLGPMGRTVGDVALMLDAQCGWHPDDPLSLAAPETPFLDAMEALPGPARVAFTPDLGLTPVAAEVRALCTRAAESFADLGAEVELACPDLGDVEEIFQTLRAAHFAASKAALLEEHRDQLKPEVIWNIEKGMALTADDIGRAERARGALYHRVAAFFERYDLLLMPTAVVPPFEVELPYLTEIGGKPLDNYVAWLVMSFTATLASCPALSVPCGFTEAGLPVGLQMVGRPRGEAALLAAARRFEARLGLADRVPIDPFRRH
jgi:amidase